MTDERVSVEEGRRIAQTVHGVDDYARRKMLAAMDALAAHPEGLTDEELQRVLDGVEP